MDFVRYCVLSWMRHVIICLDNAGTGGTAGRVIGGEICPFVLDLLDFYAEHIVCEDRTDAAASFFSTLLCSLCCSGLIAGSSPR